MSERNYLWDNIKALLIFMVVLGHFLEFSDISSEAAVNVDRFIYCFHMPAFIFVTGFWAKRYCVNGKVRAEKAATFFAYYAVFQLLFMGLRLVLNISPKGLAFFSPCRGLWYLLAVFILYLLTPLIEKLHAIPVIVVSLFFAVTVGLDKNASNYFAISRLLTFAPFYFMGYYLKDETIKKARSIKAAIRVPLGLLITAAVVAVLLIQDHTLSLKLFFAKHSFKELHLSVLKGSVLRLENIVLAVMMIAALLLMMPSKKLIFSRTGERSLQIFVLHMMLAILLIDSELIKLRIDTLPQLGLIILSAAALTVILTPKIFSYPFKWIQLGVGKIYSLKQAPKQE